MSVAHSNIHHLWPLLWAEAACGYSYSDNLPDEVTATSSTWSSIFNFYYLSFIQAVSSSLDSSNLHFFLCPSTSKAFGFS